MKHIPFLIFLVLVAAILYLATEVYQENQVQPTPIQEER